MRRGGCTCWPCRKARGLGELAPQLVKARRDQIELDRRHSVIRGRLLKAERNLAHRELQFLRAGRTRSSRYVGVRFRKLQQAQREVAGFKAQLEACR